jgi:hypothetical protein
LKKSRSRFKHQEDQNTESKRKCLNYGFTKVYSDPHRGWLDLKNESKRLLDSRNFHDYCESKELVPQHVAEHVAFEGSSVINKVLRNGIEAVLGDKALMFGKALYEDKYTVVLIATLAEKELEII